MKFKFSLHITAIVLSLSFCTSTYAQEVDQISNEALDEFGRSVIKAFKENRKDLMDDLFLTGQLWVNNVTERGSDEQKNGFLETSRTENFVKEWNNLYTLWWDNLQSKVKEQNMIEWSSIAYSHYSFEPAPREGLRNLGFSKGGRVNLWFIHNNKKYALMMTVVETQLGLKCFELREGLMVSVE